MEEHRIVQSSNHSEVHSIASLTKLVTAMVCIDSGKCDEKLLERLLVRSDNNAANKIAETYSGGRSAFVRDMNNKVQSIGLHETKFVDPSGLGVFNVSTAREYIDVVIESEKYPLIKKISSSATIKQKKVTLHNTNRVLLEGNMWGIILSKTGFTSHAGRCLALVVQSKRKYAIVILGEKSVEKRIELAKRLIGNTM
jgi:D-alanyl-D-alanine endopeptidase (penicillin-binding protein 7)